MKMKIIFVMLMILLGVNIFGNEFSEGLTIDIDDLDYHSMNTNLTLHGYIYDTKTGVLLGNSACNVNLYYGCDKIKTLSTNFSEPLVLNSSLFNQLGVYQSNIYCENTIRGGFIILNFEVVKETTFGLWTPVVDWTFPVIYLILTFLLIGIALVYTSGLFGIIGSIMLIMAYFVVGATSPILFAPLLIIGFLLAFKFATL